VKILQMSKFYPPVAGGIESVVYALAEGLNAVGQRTDVLCANTAPKTVREHKAGGYDVTRAASFGTLLSTAISPSLIAETCRLAPRYDVVHVQMPDPMAALALRIQRPRNRIVLHWQSDVISQKQALKLYAPLQDWLLRRADCIIATTPLYAEASPSLRPFLSKVTVLPIGIADPQTGDVRDRADALKRRFADRRIVFSLGRMTAYKGFEYLIQAAAALPDDVVVVVGGAGELLETHRASVRALGLEGKVDFVGRIEDDELPAYFAACDVFCLPSVLRSEAYGVVLLEAMAAARPIVATAIAGSGVPWVNQDGVTGRNVPVRDPVRLAEAIASLLDDRAMAARMGQAGRRRFEQEFTADKMVAAMVDLYSRLLGGRACEIKMFREAT
jgi:rhamnosyl/mannosyltransferase